MEEKEIPYLVITKSTIAHKVYATSKEDAIRAYKEGEEVDSFENEDNEIDDVIKY